MNVQPASFYVKQLRPLLPPEAFAPHRGLLWFLVLHLAVILAGITLIALGVGGLWAAVPLSLLVGHSFAGTAFVGHELLHGAVLKSRKVSHAVGWLCLLPFTVSPTLWKAWHNRIHHGNTMIPGIDPDAYPTMERYRESRIVRIAERFALAKGNPFGWVSVVAGFSLQHLQILIGARGQGFLERPQHRRAILESLGGLAVWGALALLIGPRAFLFAYVLPLLVANTLAMAYILTNHHLSPLNEVNDPLYNSLSVTVPKLFERLHSRFGLHVEHHLFPSMSSAHAPLVRDLLVEKWPERYQSMPLLEALNKLRTTPRIYREPTVFEDPRTGVTFPALLPRGPLHG